MFTVAVVAIGAISNEDVKKGTDRMSNGDGD